MFFSFTYFKVRSWWALPLFHWHAFFSYRQANRTPGLLQMKVWPDKGMVFCTLTEWKSREHMLEFRNKGVHLKAMKWHRKAGEGYSVSFNVNDEPNKEFCMRKLRAELSARGKLSWIVA